MVEHKRPLNPTHKGLNQKNKKYLDKWTYTVCIAAYIASSDKL